jgi:Xaa-Pro dipeptidase
MARTDELAADVRARRERFDAELERRGAQAAVIASPESFQYLTGYRSPTWAMKARPMALVVRPGEQALALVNAAEAERVAEAAIAVEPVAYRQPSVVVADGGVELEFMASVADQLVGLLGGLGVRRVGLELESHVVPRLSAAALDRLRGAAEPVDVSRALWTLRLRKSDYEVALLRRAADALAATYDAFAAEARPGQSERELRRLFVACAARAGAEETGYVLVVAGVGGAILGAATERVWEPGELLLVDSGVSVEGYWADYSRLFAAGAATADQERAYRRVVEAVEAARAAAAPGRTAASVAGAIAAALGIPESDTFGRMGHGLGLDLTEPPSLHPDDPTVLERGMTLCLEPNAVFPGVGSVVAEETVVLREGGVDLLSPPFPASLAVVT